MIVALVNDGIVRSCPRVGWGKDQGLQLSCLAESWVMEHRNFGCEVYRVGKDFE